MHSFVAKPSVGLTDGHFPRYHQWLFEGRGGEVLLNSGALKVLLAEEHKLIAVSILHEHGR